MAKKKLNLALQGGGSHGAYTWGVLDRLLEEESIEIEGISGTSAGAINAAALTAGYAKGGRDGAREMLDKVWQRISDASALSPLRKTPIERWWQSWGNKDSSMTYQWYDMMSRFYSPYDTNPMNINPLRYILDELIDFEALQHHHPIKLFVTATHVQSGQARVFQCHEIKTDVLLASACIPFVFQAIEIDGDQYWDGGYMGNPAIWPLIYHCNSEDVILVQINPIHRGDKVRAANEIIDRLNEITFNSSLIAEMRAIEFVSRLIHEGSLEKGRYKDMRMHLIYASEEMHKLSASSKMNADWDFFVELKEIGRETADHWIKTDFKHVGDKSSIDIRDKFLRGPDKTRWSGVSEKKHAQNDKHQHKNKSE